MDIGRSVSFRCKIRSGNADGGAWFEDRYDRRQAVCIPHDKCRNLNPRNKKVTNIRCKDKDYVFLLSNVQIVDKGDWWCEDIELESSNVNGK